MEEGELAKHTSLEIVIKMTSYLKLQDYTKEQ